MLGRFIGLAFAGVYCVAGAQPNVAAAADPPQALACVERLTLPRYPPLASNVRAQIFGLKASVELESDATVRSVSFESPSQGRPGEEILKKDFVKSVEASLRGAQYRTECGGQTVTFVFDFRLSQGPAEDGRVVFTYPNRLEVSDITPLIQTARAPQARPGRRKK